MEKSKARVCKDCGSIFPSKSELKAHRKAEHKDRKVDMFTVGGETLQLVDDMTPIQTFVDFSRDTDDMG